MTMEYLLETHFHTKETSPCAQVSAAESVPAYREKGYSGIVVTDHYRGNGLGRKRSRCGSMATTRRKKPGTSAV